MGRTNPTLLCLTGLLKTTTNYLTDSTQTLSDKIRPHPVHMFDKANTMVFNSKEQKYVFQKILIFGDTKSVKPIGMGEEFLKELLLPSPA